MQREPRFSPDGHGSDAQPRNFLFGAVLAISLVALFVFFTWYDASQRISAIEGRVDRLANLLTLDASADEWRPELDALVVRLAELEREQARVSKQGSELLRAEVARLKSELDTHVDGAIAMAVAPAARAIEASAGSQLSDIHGSAPLSEEEETDTLDFDSRLETEYQILGLLPEREAEIGPALELALESVWLAYVKHIETGRPEAATIRARYCNEVQAFWKRTRSNGSVAPHSIASLP